MLSIRVHVLQLAVDSLVQHPGMKALHRRSLSEAVTRSPIVSTITLLRTEAFY